MMSGGLACSGTSRQQSHDRRTEVRRQHHPEMGLGLRFGLSKDYRRSRDELRSSAAPNLTATLPRDVAIAGADDHSRWTG